jgi:hypothetical protein
MQVRPTEQTTALPPMVPPVTRSPARYVWAVVIVALLAIGVAVFLAARGDGGTAGSAVPSTTTPPTAPATTTIGADLDAALSDLEKAVKP